MERKTVMSQLSAIEKNRLEQIAQLTNIPSPTGNTKQIVDYISQLFDKLNLNYKVTPKGGILVTVKGKDQDQRRFVTAHVDTLGGMVRAIKPDGRLKIDRIGGYTYASIDGVYATVHAVSTGNEHSGTILLHQTSVHTYSNSATAERNQDNMELRLDEKVFSAEDVKKLGIQVGDFISFHPRTEITDTGYIKSRHLDDKVSVALVLEVLTEISQGNLSLPVTTYFYISTNEEIGYGGNSNIHEKVVEYLAVDMGAMGDDQQTDEYSVSICVKDASGPYHLAFRQHLVELAKKYDIPYQLDIYPNYGSDASAAMKAGADVKHALFGAGIDASHAYERTHIESINATYQLLVAYLESPLI